MKQFFGKKKLAKLVTLSVMAGAMLGVAQIVSAATVYVEGQGNGKVVSSTDNPESVYSYTTHNGTKYRLVGGYGDKGTQVQYAAAISGGLTVESGVWDSVVGGNWIKTAGNPIDGSSASILFNDGQARAVTGGTMYSADTISSDISTPTSGRATSVKITSGEIGIFASDLKSGDPITKDYGTNVYETAVTGGDFIKTGDQSSKTKAESFIDKTKVEITGGNVNAAVLGGSFVSKWYAGDKGPQLVANVKEAEIDITGGKFTHVIAGGGASMAAVTESNVAKTIINIDGTSGNLQVDCDIYAGGMRSQVSGMYGYYDGTKATVNEAVITIKNATVQSVYGTGVEAKNTGTQSLGIWSYVPNADVVPTTLKFIDSFYTGEIYVPNGTVSFEGNSGWLVSENETVNSLNFNGGAIKKKDGVQTTPIVTFKPATGSSSVAGSLTNTNVTGVHIDVLGGATLNIDGGTFTNTGFSEKNYGDYSIGANIYFDKTSTGEIKNAIFKDSSTVGEKGCSGSIYAGGTITLENTQFINNSAWETGAVGLMGKNNVLKDVTFDGNRVLSNDSGHVYDYGGGALFLGAASTTIITDSLFQNNEGAASAGAIGIRRAQQGETGLHAAKLDIVDTVFKNNVAATTGGALDNYFYNSVNKPRSTDSSAPADQDGYAYVGGSTFDGNRANEGAAIYNHGDKDWNLNIAKLYVKDSSFTDNVATTRGGAIVNDKDATLVLDNVTFRGNTAAGKPNDIYNAGILTLNNVKFEDITKSTVVNDTTGTITIGKDTRVTATTIDNKAAATALTMVGGTLVTESITTGEGAAVAGADKFTMTSGVVEYGEDYKLADATAWANVVKNINGGAFSLKLTGNLIQEQGQEPEPVSLETLIEQKIEMPTAPVDAKSLVTGEGEQKQLKIGGDSDKIKEDLAVGTIDVGDAKKLVIMPVNMGQQDEKEIVLEFGNSEASGPLIVTKNNEKVDVELAEGAKIVVAPKQKLEIANLDAKNNGDKHVTLAGEIAAEKFNVAAPENPTQEIICFNVGNDEQMGSLSVGEVGMNGAMVFADPAWANDITEASAYSQGGTEINGKLVGGRNSVISVGTADRTVAEQIFKDMKTFSFGNEGDVNAVLYVATAQTMADTGAIVINGSLTKKPAGTDVPVNKSFTVAAKSLTMVEAAAAGSNGAISGLTSASVDSAAKLFIANAEPNKVYTILTGENITYGWEKDNVSVNGVIKDLQVEREDTYFKVTTGTVGFNVPGAVIPNVGDAITLDAGSKALDVLFKMVDVPSEAQKAANVNTYANLGENLGVTRGAYDVISMTGEAINQHWANKEDGESVWAVYNHSKDKVDGLKLGGMDAQYDAQYNGVTVGYDINKDFGIALNHIDGNVSNGYGGHNDAKYYGISVYGRKNFGKVNLLGDVTYSHGKNELEQNGISADAKTNTFSMGVTAKYDTNMVKVGNVTPFAGVRYVRIDGKDYTDSIGVNREADKVNSVIVPMGVEYSAEFNVSGSDWNCKPVLALGYLFNFGDKDNTMTLSYNGAKDSFGYDFVDNGAFFTKAALNFTKNNLTLGVGYDYMKSSNSNNNKWNVSLNYAF